MLKQASYLKIPVCFQRKRLTDVNALSCDLGNLKLVYAVLVTVVAHLQATPDSCISDIHEKQRMTRTHSILGI